MRESTLKSALRESTRESTLKREDTFTAFTFMAKEAILPI